jgi:hypothetical protein
VDDQLFLGHNQASLAGPVDANKCSLWTREQPSQAQGSYATPVRLTTIAPAIANPAA